ncbi:MAG: hypothetical protein B9J98_06760 [Candidatus Terraquivivens tikiterensis]|uniref:Uncharacterized protein n=1 Tax=Candidatus Terraquivivens tikiterensis TaxID=1980982 RepID=A0A2R7Y1Q1_9ARCH|nr:MAG: hypothetical protein B9J98_06760 [Candidatus Terraquivivens tikiterensis]
MELPEPWGTPCLMTEAPIVPGDKAARLAHASKKKIAINLLWSEKPIVPKKVGFLATRRRTLRTIQDTTY